MFEVVLLLLLPGDYFPASDVMHLQIISIFIPLYLSLVKIFLSYVFEMLSVAIYLIVMAISNQSGVECFIH